jgi:hypothetical protein
MTQFTPEAMQIFNKIPDDIKSKILSNVYCSKCKDSVKIVDFKGSIDSGDLILQGKCEVCSSKVARLIEG